MAASVVTVLFIGAPGSFEYGAYGADRTMVGFEIVRTEGKGLHCLGAAHELHATYSALSTRAIRRCTIIG